MDLENGKYRITKAFELDGMEYYCFDNSLQIPADRAHAAVAIWEELRMRCTKEYLELHCRAVDKILNRKEFGIQDVIYLRTIHNNLVERLNLAPHPEMIYKYASVVFMDGSESPYSYDWQYNMRKIEKWKALNAAQSKLGEPGPILDFFLRMPMLNLIPHLGMSAPHFHLYLEVAEAMQLKHLSDIREA